MLMSLLSTEWANYLCSVQLKIGKVGTKNQMLHTFDVLVVTMIKLVKQIEI